MSLKASVELFALLQDLSKKKKTRRRARSSAAPFTLLLIVLQRFTSTYLVQQDVHHIAVISDTEACMTVPLHTASLSTTLEVKESQSLALRRLRFWKLPPSTRLPIYALFDGQGINEVYFDELQSLYDVCKPFVASFISVIATNLFLPLSTAYASTNYYAYSLSVISWLT
jgi:fatty acid synthase subunit alpha, fungi type